MDDTVATAALDPDTSERFLSLRRALGVSTFGLNQIKLLPGQAGRVHRHERQEEVYIVWQGVLTVLVEERQTYELRRGDCLRVGPGVRRQVINRHSEPVVLIALGGANEHESRDAHAYRDWSDAEGGQPQEIPLPDDLPADQLLTP